MQEERPRKTRELTTGELEKLDRVFSLYGNKAFFAREYGYTVATIYNIMKRRSGLEYIVNDMVKYAEKELEKHQ